MRSAEAEAGRLGNARLMNFASFSLLPALPAKGRGSAAQPSSQCITNQLCPTAGRRQRRLTPGCLLRSWLPAVGRGRVLGALLLPPESSEST